MDDEYRGTRQLTLKTWTTPVWADVGWRRAVSTNGMLMGSKATATVGFCPSGQRAASCGLGPVTIGPPMIKPVRFGPPTTLPWFSLAERAVVDQPLFKQASFPIATWLGGPMRLNGSVMLWPPPRLVGDSSIGSKPKAGGGPFLTTESSRALAVVIIG